MEFSERTGLLLSAREPQPAATYCRFSEALGQRSSRNSLWVQSGQFPGALIGITGRPHSGPVSIVAIARRDRYDKLAAKYLAFVNLICNCRLRAYEPTANTGVEP